VWRHRCHPTAKKKKKKINLLVVAHMQNGRVAAGGSVRKRRRTTTNVDTSKKQNGALRPRDVVPIEQVLTSSVPLRERLASMGATTLPWYVVEKQLKASDVHCNQARLLFSCKSSVRPLSPRAPCFTTEQRCHPTAEQRCRRRRLPWPRIAFLAAAPLPTQATSPTN
jgi:hypothetical protein